MGEKIAGVIRRRALRLDQNKEHPLFLFTLTGEELLRVADIFHVSRNGAGKLLGYQRGEVKRHIQEIVEYLDSGDVLFPNSVILALSSRVRFTLSRGPQVDDGISSAGILEIPLPAGNGPKPAWIVDGQQRAIALSRSRRLDLPIPVNAFVADEVETQRDQFLRVNNTKPLPRGLITELLPEVSGPLPSRLAARKIPSAVCDLLARDPESPFYGLIRRPSMTTEDKKNAVVTDTSIVKMIEDSISSPSGALFPHRNIATGETDFDSIRQMLFIYWRGVRKAFPEAWGRSPTASRLMHGAGIRAMGRLMDRVMGSINPGDARASARVEHELALVAPSCHWTSGRWKDLDDMQWDEIQNVPRHIRLLSSHLIRTYIHARGAAA